MLQRMSINRVVTRFRFVVPVAFLAATLGACGDDDDPSGPGGPEISAEWFESVSAQGGSVSMSGESAPAAGSGPAVDASLSSSFISGGTTQLEIGSLQQFDGLILALQDVDGHIAVDYNSARTSATVSVTLRGDVPANNFTLRVAGTQGSQVGSYTSIPVNIVQVGTGPVQVSVSWDAPSDVDLYLVEPGGEVIYYGNDVSDNGGELDLDSNAGCGIDGINNENITYPSGSPPRGQYTVRVNYWSACSVSQTNYVVTVRVQGQATRTFTGSFTGSGTGGGSSAGTVITTFTR